MTGPRRAIPDPRSTTDGAEVEFSIGVDVEDVTRFAAAATDTTLRALFATTEVEHCERFADAAARFAGTWCAKEATVKALWPWVRLDPRRVTVHHAADGRPHVVVSDWSLDDAGVRVRVSISHGGAVATASVVAWGARPNGVAAIAGSRPLTR